MKISMFTMAVDTFVPMLESLDANLEKGASHAKSTNQDLVNARLAPDMYPLCQQVQQACYYAKDGTARLAGKSPVAAENAERSFPAFKTQIHKTLRCLRDLSEKSFDGADERDCSIDTPDGRVIEMDGLRFLRAWALPHFYFHVVTAYDILRHRGVAIGKQDYLSQVGAFIRDKRR